MKTGFDNEAKVGLMATIVLVVTIFMAYKTGDFTFQKKGKYPVVVDFENVSALDVGDMVQVAGVIIGEVISIELIDGKGRVVLEVDENVSLSDDAGAWIKTYGMLGERYIEIDPGTPGGSPLSHGQKIEPRISSDDFNVIIGKLGSIADDVKAVTSSLSEVFGSDEGESSLRDILANLRTLSADLRRVVAENNEAFSRITGNLDRLSGDLSTLVAENREAVSETLASLPETSENVRAASRDLAGILAENREQLRVALANFESASGRLDTALADIEEISAKVNSGEGLVGTLIKDDELVEEVRWLLGELKASVEDAREQAPISALINALGVAF